MHCLEAEKTGIGRSGPPTLTSGPSNATTARQTTDGMSPDTTPSTKNAEESKSDGIVDSPYRPIQLALRLARPSQNLSDNIAAEVGNAPQILSSADRDVILHAISKPLDKNVTKLSVTFGSPAPHSKQLPFMSLAVEVRAIVYDFLFAKHKIVVKFLYKVKIEKTGSIPGLSLLQTSKALYADARSIAYGKLVICFQSTTAANAFLNERYDVVPPLANMTIQQWFKDSSGGLGRALSRMRDDSIQIINVADSKPHDMHTMIRMATFLATWLWRKCGDEPDTAAVEDAIGMLKWTSCQHCISTPKMPKTPGIQLACPCESSMKNDVHRELLQRMVESVHKNERGKLVVEQFDCTPERERVKAEIDEAQDVRQAWGNQYRTLSGNGRSHRARKSHGHQHFEPA